MKKSILILAVLVIISCAVSHKPEFTTDYDTNFEILNGKVRQLSEIQNTADSGIETNITDFDMHGNATQTKTKGGCECLVKYEYEYNKNGKKTTVIEDNGEQQNVYKCDKNGRIAEASFDTKAENIKTFKPILRKFFYKYNNAGYLIEFDSYLDTEHQIMDKYKYNDQSLLIEKEIFSGSGYLEGKSFISINLLTKKGIGLKGHLSLIMSQQKLTLLSAKSPIISSWIL